MAISYELLSQANTHELLSPGTTHLHKTQFLQHPLMELDLEQKAEPILVLFSLFRPKCAFVFFYGKWHLASLGGFGQIGLKYKMHFITTFYQDMLEHPKIRVALIMCVKIRLACKINISWYILC